MKTSAIKKRYYVGISGHRDPLESETKKYKAQIKERLRQIAAAHPDREVVILSPLADGADRLIVYVAKELGFRYEVLLPMPQELYEMDFDEASLREFRRLRYEARKSEEVPLCQGYSREDISVYGEARDKQYRAVGEAVVDRSDEMIFLWDGIDNGLAGGTADIVQYTKNRAKSFFIIKCKRES